MACRPSGRSPGCAENPPEIAGAKIKGSHAVIAEPKAALNMLGHNVGGLRLPLVEATEQEAEEVRAMLQRHGLAPVSPARAPA